MERIGPPMIPGRRYRCGWPHHLADAASRVSFTVKEVKGGYVFAHRDDGAIEVFGLHSPMHIASVPDNPDGGVSN